ncbi:hypothetical protein DPMN_055861 [Dreissena polymorpha]|uniref:Uncharacterized protein n=1 Tax=Dreissena polymorpha TaxID=45954 RepID=A0A9D4HUH1_DREPO|nr:hypothetical protein DPMN_055861 [Dreissena polymorpha]
MSQDITKETVLSSEVGHRHQCGTTAVTSVTSWVIWLGNINRPRKIEALIPTERGRKSLLPI